MELVTSLRYIPVGTLWPKEDITTRVVRVAAAGLHFSVTEGLPVHESIKLGDLEQGRYIGQSVENLERLARHGVHTACYNFIPLLGWIRTEPKQPLPDGFATPAFHQAALKRMNSERDVWALPGWNFSIWRGGIRTLPGQYRALEETGLWNNLRYFLQAVVPEAERLGIRPAIHPDDLPLPIFGLPRVASTLEDLLRLTGAVDLPSNGMTPCTGSLDSSRASDAIRITNRLYTEDKVSFVHGRNVRQEREGDFCESGHLIASRSLDMVAVLATLHRRGFDGVIRVDHGRMVWGKRGCPGYGLYDRAMGICYLIGLWETLCYFY